VPPRCRRSSRFLRDIVVDEDRSPACGLDLGDDFPPSLIQDIRHDDIGSLR
jgi:hypothetical protein